MGKGPFFGFDEDKLEFSRKLGSQLPDKHYEHPKIGLSVEWVGIANQRYFIPTNVEAQPFTVNALVEANITLPAHMRGFNVSRCNEAIVEIVSKNMDYQRSNKLQELPGLCAMELLRRHEYADRSRVSIEFDYPYSDKTPSGISTHESCRVTIQAGASRGDQKATVTESQSAVQIGGVLACPLALSLLQVDAMDCLVKEGIDKSVAMSLVEKLPIGTHMEHSFSLLSISVPGSRYVDFTDLLEIAREAIGRPFIELLKRNDELSVLKKLLQTDSCMLAEDVVRLIAKSIIEKFSDFPSETGVYILQESHFTFSSFRIKAQKLSTLGQIIQELSAIKGASRKMKERSPSVRIRR
jgi:MptA/FolE2 family GTP cyclohydrolase